MKKTGLLFVAIIALFTACNASKDKVKMTVASEKRVAMGVAPMKVFLVKEGDDKKWSFFYSNIEGFDYQPGYEYVLEVRKDDIGQPVPADASSIRYILVREISKIQKASENMPEDIQIRNNFVWTAKVIDVTEANIGVGAAQGRFPVRVVKLQVTALNGRNLPFAEGDTIHAELVAEPKVAPQKGGEYIFKAESSHPAHALGVYMLGTDVQDLVR